MVQFGKTEQHTTNNQTTNDTSKHETNFVLDKTSQQFINVKDIITTTNIYKNMDLTILAATMALSIAAPLINGLIQKAINRWNDEVPENMQDEADREMFLLETKCRSLSQHGISGLVIDDISDVKVNAKDFLILQRRVNEHMKKTTYTATSEIVEGFCKKDKGRVLRGESILMNLHETFSTSIIAATENDPETSMIGDFKYDHALECLSRILPSGMMCTSNSFLVRKMTTVTHMQLSQVQVNEIEEKLSMFYQIKKMKYQDDLFVLQLIPFNREITVQMLSSLYGYDLTLISNAHFFSMNSRQEWYLAGDPNLSVEAILEAKLGHSIAVLGEVIDEIATHCAEVLRERNPHDDAQNTFLQADKGPFKCKIKMRQFSDPLSLFDVRSEDDLLPLDKNFKVITALIRVCGLLKVHYPLLMKKGDRLMQEYIFRSKTAAESTYQSRELPSAPVFTLRPHDTDQSTMYAPSNVGFSQYASPVPAKIYPRIEDVKLVEVTGLDELILALEIEDPVEKGLRKLSDLPENIRKKMKQKFKETAFTVIRQIASQDINSIKIRVTHTETVNEILGSSTSKPSYEYRNQVWYYRGDRLFDNRFEFRDSAVVRDIVQPL